MNRLVAVAFILFCFEIGLFLVFVPWSALWEHNVLLAYSFTLHRFLLNNFDIFSTGFIISKAFGEKEKYIYIYIYICINLCTTHSQNNKPKQTNVPNSCIRKSLVDKWAATIENERRWL